MGEGRSLSEHIALARSARHRDARDIVDAIDHVMDRRVRETAEMRRVRDAHARTRDEEARKLGL
jgi:hypothetical protein